MQVLERIALLIKENPSITVQEIATRLGYSEEKSIYYWLEKSRYSGIKDFKRAVLTGEFLPQSGSQQPPPETAREPDTFLLYPTTSVPVIDSFTNNGSPQYRDGQNVLTCARTLSPGSFAYLLTVDKYAPYLLCGDLLLIDPVETPTNGCILMLWIPTSEVLLRRYYGTGDRTFFIHPVTGSNLLDESPAVQPRIVGRVLHAIRSF